MDKKMFYINEENKATSMWTDVQGKLYSFLRLYKAKSIKKWFSQFFTVVEELESTGNTFDMNLNCK